MKMFIESSEARTLKNPNIDFLERYIDTHCPRTYIEIN